MVTNLYFRNPNWQLIDNPSFDIVEEAIKKYSDVRLTIVAKIDVFGALTNRDFILNIKNADGKYSTALRLGIPFLIGKGNPVNYQLKEFSLENILEAVRHFPDSFDLWDLIA
jgi:hypothetical protein